MSSNKRREERKKEIEQIREEGYDAAKSGKSIYSCPRKYIYDMNKYHWEEGYRYFVPEEENPIKIFELTADDFPNTRLERDGSDIKEVPDASAKNFEVLVEKINEIIKIVNKL